MIAYLLPEQYRESWCIAGGWAVAPALATDMDVWVYGVPTADLEVVGSALLSHLKELREGKPRGPYYEDQEDSREQPGYMENRNVRKVAKIFLHQNQPVHLLVTDCMAVGELLEGFDISTHMVAIDHTGLVIKGSGYSPLTLPPVAHLATPTTPERMKKIAARYGHLNLKGEITR